jgi:hypothetical protein
MASVVAWLAIGCGAEDPAPPARADSTAPEVLFLVRNQVLAIHLDGTDRRTLGTVGDDRHRTGYPRFLPDGRVAVLGDETGGIFPFVGPRAGGTFTRITLMNVTVHDSLCGLTVGGASRLLFTETPFVAGKTRLQRLDVDHPALEQVGLEPHGTLATPSPAGDGHVLVARTTDAGTSTVELVDVSGQAYTNGASARLAEVVAPFIATYPAQLPDGRVVFIRSNPNDPSDSGTGELFVIDDAGTRSTGITGVIALEVIGDRVVYEEGGANGVSDLIATDLAGAPVNVTNTPYVSEHLAWSD